MADNENNNSEELTREQKILILKLFKSGVYKRNNQVNSLIKRLCSIWEIDETEL